VGRPIKQLEAFKRVTVMAGQTKTVELPLSARALAYWDTPAHKWVLKKDQVSLAVSADRWLGHLRSPQYSRSAGFRPSRRPTEKKKETARERKTKVRPSMSGKTKRRNFALEKLGDFLAKFHRKPALHIRLCLVQ
jgi:Fibronectin type III-like domain